MQGDLGHSWPSEVVIRAEAGFAVMVTVSSVPRVAVLQPASASAIAAPARNVVLMASPRIAAPALRISGDPKSRSLAVPWLRAPVEGILARAQGDTDRHAGKVEGLPQPVD